MRHIKLNEWRPNTEKTFNVTGNPWCKSVLPNYFNGGDYEIKVNSYGFISNDEPQFSKPIKVLLGDSIFETLFMHEENRIHSLLQKNNPAVNYLNHGVSCTTTIDALNIIVNKLIPLGVKEVVISTGGADIHGLYHTKERKFEFMNNPNEARIELDMYKQRELLLSGCISLLRSFDIKVILCTQGHRIHKNDLYYDQDYYNMDLVPPRGRKEMAKMNAITRRVAENLDVKLIDFEKLMSDFDYWYDSSHLTPKGARFVADKLIEIGF